MRILITFTIVSALVLGAGCTLATNNQVNTPAILDSQKTLEETTTVIEEAESVPTTRVFNTSELGDIDSHLNFTATIPSHWEAEYIKDIQAINIYDPTAADASPLEQSQIFIRYFTATDFLTLQTVTIHSRIETTINDRPTVIYDIEKKPSVADFASQPTWRSQRHIVTDIRSKDDSTATFYVFGKRPDLDQAVFDEFINLVVFK